MFFSPKCTAGPAFKDMGLQPLQRHQHFPRLSVSIKTKIADQNMNMSRGMNEEDLSSIRCVGAEHSATVTSMSSFSVNMCDISKIRPDFAVEVGPHLWVRLHTKRQVIVPELTPYA